MTAIARTTSREGIMGEVYCAKDSSRSGDQLLTISYPVNGNAGSSYPPHMTLVGLALLEMTHQGDA